VCEYIYIYIYIHIYEYHLLSLIDVHVQSTIYSYDIHVYEVPSAHSSFFVYVCIHIYIHIYEWHVLFLIHVTSTIYMIYTFPQFHLRIGHLSFDTFDYSIIYT